MVTTEPFPHGMAATNRIISWTKVLAGNNIPVKVYIIRPTEKEPRVLNREATGIFKKIAFEYVNGTTVWPIHKGKFFKLGILLAGYRKMIRSLASGRPSTVVTYTANINIKLLLLILQFFYKFRLIIEETEYPKILKRKHTKIEKWLHLSLYKYSNGMLVMTKELKKYYSSLGVSNIMILPMTVDTNRFEQFRKLEKEPYFAYAGGSGGFFRDGVFDIVKGFSFFAELNSEIALKIIGPIDKKSDEYQKIIHFIDEKGLNKRVEFAGRVSSELIPDFLIKATGLVMAPPEDFKSGGFPTKLGEFLASGTPVICTNVSEIPIYLNQFNAFIVPPGDYQGIGNAMHEIIKDPEASKRVGNAGKKLAETVFNAEVYFMDLDKLING